MYKKGHEEDCNLELQFGSFFFTFDQTFLRFVQQSHLSQSHLLFKLHPALNSLLQEGQVLLAVEIFLVEYQVYWLCLFVRRQL